MGVELFYRYELEAGSLYTNFEVEGDRPIVKSLEEKGEFKAELVDCRLFREAN